MANTTAAHKKGSPTLMVQFGAPQYWSAWGCRVTGAPDGPVALSVTGAGASMEGGPTTSTRRESVAVLPFESTIE